MRSQTLIYVDLDFLMEFNHHLSQPIGELDDNLAIKIMLIRKLLNTTLRIIMPKDELVNIITDERNSLEKTILVKYNANNILKSCWDDFDKLKVGNLEDLEVLPDFVLLGDKAYNEHKDLGDKMGIIILSSKLNFDIALGDNVTIDIPVGSFTLSPHTLNKLNAAHTVIIYDWYFLNNNFYHAENKFVNILLENLSKGINKTKIYILIPQRESMEINLQKHYDRYVTNLNNIANTFNQKENIQIVIKPVSKKLHARNIFSNTYWITCDYGFNHKYPDFTTWQVKPLGIYYSQINKYMQELQQHYGLDALFPVKYQ